MQSRTLNRAKLFLSFDSLKGYREIIRKKERIVVDPKELSEDDCYELNWKIQQIRIGQMINIIYFDRNEYVLLEGMVTDIDLDYKKMMRIVDKCIMVSSIIKIESKFLENMNEDKH